MIYCLIQAGTDCTIDHILTLPEKNVQMANGQKYLSLMQETPGDRTPGDQTGTQKVFPSLFFNCSPAARSI